MSEQADDGRPPALVAAAEHEAVLIELRSLLAAARAQQAVLRSSLATAVTFLADVPHG